MTHAAPTRRSLIRAGAWTAPAIVLATAAPAFAVSGGRALVLTRGDTGVVDEFGLGSLRFRDFTILVGSAVGEGALTMTVTNPGHALTELATPDGWSVTTSSARKVVYARSAAASAGEVVAVPDGTYVNDNGSGGAFVLVFAALDHDHAEIEFAIRG